MDFLSCEKRFLLFKLFFLHMEAFTEISGNNLLGEDFAPVENDFLSSGNSFFLFRGSFLQMETATEIS